MARAFLLSKLRLLQDFSEQTHIDAFARVDRSLQRA